MRQLRILSIINELMFGGDENRLLSLATTIDRDQFDLRVLTLKRPNAKAEEHFGSMREHYAAAGIAVQSLDEEHANNGLTLDSTRKHLRRAAMLQRSVARVCRLIRDEGIDIVDGHTGPGNLIAVAAGVACSIPRVVTTYDLEPWDPRWIWGPVYRNAFRLSDAIVTDSESAAENARRFMNKRRYIHVIPNGVVAPPSGKTSLEMRRFFDLPTDRNVQIVGQISTLFPFKGHMVLIEAARTILERRPNTAFLLVGYARDDASYRDRLLQRARELGIADRVRIVGYPGPIGDVWQTIDVHAHPTLSDSLPNVIIEGMSLRKPAVVTDVGGIATLVDHGRTGLVVPPGDAEALAAGLLRLLGDGDYARRIAKAARARYEEAYTPLHMTEQLQRMFVDLAA
jgi:glycosyltransferase involved in cell wall biosynthesis